MKCKQFSLKNSHSLFSSFGGGLGKQGRDNKQGGRIGELTIFAKTYLLLVYFLILLGLKLYGYLNTISNQNAYYFTVRLL